LAAVDPDRDLTACLPALVAAGDSIGTTSRDCARRFGLPAGIPVATGGGDNMMAAIGTGNVVAGRLTMSLGTSGTLFAYSDSPVVDRSGNIAAFCSSTGGWLPLLCTMNCTSATELIRGSLDIALEAFDETIAGVAAGCGGLTVLPFFSGERTPNLPGARAEILGLTPTNATKAHLLRATVEGVTFGLRFGLDELRRLGVEAGEIVLTGGGAGSLHWRQIVADICNLPVTMSERDEGACFGAALQALWMLERVTEPTRSIVEITARHVRPVAQVAPDTESVAIYERTYAAYRSAVARAAESSTARLR
ncbi:MAG TPA: FGGY-family carbohydrate kinase, partial [Gammaproteobacteria bacterium]|nr:FGGY-family carbohydrate kinase [Gammaproteobacteria bacterium]